MVEVEELAIWQNMHPETPAAIAPPLSVTETARKIHAGRWFIVGIYYLRI